MIPQHLDLMKNFINPSYAAQAEQSRNSRTKLISSLMNSRRMPEEGWDEDLIRQFLAELASFDTNNFPGNVGVGEREGRVICDQVRRRHYGLSHGIGRSGDVMAEQPKAAGSSLLVQLTRYLALDAIHLSGIKAASSCAVLPAATGMTIMLVFLALRQTRPQAKYVVWSRIDQKSCFKAIGAAGMESIVVELRPLDGNDSLGTDVSGIREAITRVGAEHVLCICSTTSTFAPRVPDSIDDIAILAKELDVPHVVNNAYGLQCSKCAHLIEQGCRRGRVDAFVQSTDKNFLVPVGGAIVAGPTSDLVERVSAMYPGRASMSPLLDLFITLLSLGASGWKNLLKQRKENATWFQAELSTLVGQHGLRVLQCPNNKISFAIDVSPLASRGQSSGSSEKLSFLGSALFLRRVSGPRVVLCDPPAQKITSEEAPEDVDTSSVQVKGKYRKTIDGTSFESYGAHTDTYPCCYLTAACAVGATQAELQVFLDRLSLALQEYSGSDKTKSKQEGKAATGTPAVAERENVKESVAETEVPR